MSAPTLLVDAPLVVVTPWHHLTVCRRASLARTHVTVVGVLDCEAIEAIDDVARAAERDAHAFTLDLTYVTTITADARDALIIRGYRSESEAS
ncbi:hypothetical protein OJ997_00520 [Solirubrobacter phytolaccae]|uniref:Uncharacterized protein n=1 Tax=Solirubrobacter phytolaccae TaxID=1404360 RepID=A0A9X3N5L2_9ACTN|nr:hypothetical protein [Solirubrobacter phytolaccae]MDA0178762.1 hypothetical protein [Solirubrobacter phytolaccae]